MSSPSRHAFRAIAADDGRRLDQFVSDKVTTLSRSRVKSLILAGRLKAGAETITDPAYRVKPGQAFALTVPDPAPARPQGEPIALDIVYEDDALIVIDKPAGLVVHPAPGNPHGTLVNALIAHCGASLTGIGDRVRPGIVHRLDKDTSGLMVAAKTEAALAGLARQFATHSIERRYLALVWGVPQPAAGRIEQAIGRDPHMRKRMAAGVRHGRWACTHYRMVRPIGAHAALVECRLETGRTHQVRVHMAHIGHALIGDPLYASRRAPRGVPEAARTAARVLARQALHAAVLGFAHPVSDAPLRFETAAASDFVALEQALAVL